MFKSVSQNYKVKKYNMRDQDSVIRISDVFVLNNDNKHMQGISFHIEKLEYGMGDIILSWLFR